MSSFMILGGYSIVISIPVEEKNINWDLSIEHLPSRPKATFLSKKNLANFTEQDNIA